MMIMIFFQEKKIGVGSVYNNWPFFMDNLELSKKAKLFSLIPKILFLYCCIQYFQAYHSILVFALNECWILDALKDQLSGTASSGVA